MNSILPLTMLLPMTIAGHLLGDWIVQTDHEATNKMKPGFLGWWAMFEHVWTYTFVMYWCISWCFDPWRSHGFDLGPWHLWAFLGISAVTHAIIDRRTPVRWLMRVTGSPNFSKSEWGVIATDQALHLSILCILVATLGR